MTSDIKNGDTANNVEIDERAYIKREDINKRTITELFFSCPHCDEEINDLEHGISDEMECPHCYKEIMIGKPKYTLQNGKTYDAIGLQDPLTEQEMEDLIEADEDKSSISTGMNNIFKKLDVEKPIDVSAKSIAKNMNKTFRNLDGKSICRRCNGKGYLISYIIKTTSCKRCNGKGWVVA